MEKEIKILSEGTNMRRARVYLRERGYNTVERQTILDAVRRDIPNARLRNCKFLMGVTRMFIEEEFIDREKIFGINNALRFISDDSHVNEYDFNLNGLTCESIIKRFKSVSVNEFEKDKIDSIRRTSNFIENTDYDIFAVDNFEEASKYSKYTSWCVTKSDTAYDSYTAYGTGRFYFCIKKGFEKIHPMNNKKTPLDEYGLSMIAVSITMDGESNTITCRYNHDKGGNDSILTVKQLEQLLGRSFYTTFKPYTESELKARGKYISKKIGKYYLDLNKEIEGIIAAVDINENPTIIINLEEEKPMTWYDAMKYNKTLKNGWHVPCKEELEEMWFIKMWNNIITKKINDGIKRYNKNIYNKLKETSLFVEWTNSDGEIIKFEKNKPIII